MPHFFKHAIFIALGAQICADHTPFFSFTLRVTVKKLSLRLPRPFNVLKIGETRRKSLANLIRGTTGLRHVI